MRPGLTSTYRPLVLGVILLGASSHLAAQTKLPLYYVTERPPYFELEGTGRLQGIAGTATEKALVRAGVPFEWVKLPATRLLLTLEKSAAPGCAPSYFKTPEREAWAKFTLPIFRDEPQAVLAHQGFEPGSNKLIDVLANPSFNVLVKQSFSYGSNVDLLLRQAKARIKTVTVDTPSMAQMVARGRADFMFITKAEAQAIITLKGLSTVRILNFEDTPPGELRYIICNRKVEDSVIERINTAIAFKPS